MKKKYQVYIPPLLRLVYRLVITMSKQYDYDIIVKKINLFKKPSDLEVRIECGKQVIIIPTTSNNDYRMWYRLTHIQNFHQLFNGRSVILTKISYSTCNPYSFVVIRLNEYNGSITTNLVATMPFNQISTQSTHYGMTKCTFHSYR